MENILSKTDGGMVMSGFRVGLVGPKVGEGTSVVDPVGAVGLVNVGLEVVLEVQLGILLFVGTVEHDDDLFIWTSEIKKVSDNIFTVTFCIFNTLSLIGQVLCRHLKTISHSVFV